MTRFYVDKSVTATLSKTEYKIYREKQIQRSAAHSDRNVDKRDIQASSCII
jgi:hypothetical protein